MIWRILVSYGACVPPLRKLHDQSPTFDTLWFNFIKILTGRRGFNCKYFKIPLSEETWTQRLTQTKYGKMTLQPRSRVRILIYRTWTIQNELKLLAPCIYIFKFLRELQQQIRRRLRKRHLKSEFALLQTLSRLFQLVQFVKYCQISLELNSKRLQSSGKEEESRCLVSTSSTKREIRHFHVVVDRATTAEKCTKKRDARAKI